MNFSVRKLTLPAVGGPDRPPSKRMLEQLRAEEQERRRGAREGRPSAATAAQGEQEGYWAYMQRQVQERTEQLGLTGESMDRLEENSSGWADDVSKYVSTQKRKAVFGCECKQWSLSCLWSLVLTSWVRIHANLWPSGRQCWVRSSDYEIGNQKELLFDIFAPRLSSVPLIQDHLIAPRLIWNKRKWMIPVVIANKPGGLLIMIQTYFPCLPPFGSMHIRFAAIKFAMRR